MTNIEFEAWPKIPRGKGEGMTITEKMDGTNACIVVHKMEDTGEHFVIAIQSRKRFITPEDDNYGFAGWVRRNEEELLKLGEGHHFGEWTGVGIGGNPHCLPEKQFFLFNTARWNDKNPNLPDCCKVVPVLFHGLSSAENIDNTLDDLWENAEGKYVPEGIVIWFHKTRRYEKYTFENTHGKWMNA